jgi:hypothetical protein
MKKKKTNKIDNDIKKSLLHAVTKMSLELQYHLMVMNKLGIINKKELKKSTINVTLAIYDNIQVKLEWEDL